MKGKYLFLAILLSLVSSCNYLDFDETSGLRTKEDIYRYFDNTKSMLTHIYSYMPQDFGCLDGAMRDCASDDAEYAYIGAAVQDFNNGNWSSLNTHDNAWGLYNAIRAANGFLIEIEKVDFSDYQYNGSYKQWMDQLQYFPYEARVLRAFYFFELARRYGDIAMPLTVLGMDEANTVEKTKFDDVIKFITDECDACAPELPETYHDVLGSETGRVTKGFAMALKSKALLYAASKLHNPSMDKKKWELSAKAALDLINAGFYQLDKDIVANNNVSKELVLCRMNGDDYSFELANFPIRFTEGRRGFLTSSTFPSENLASAFETINGYSVTLTNTGYASADPQFDPHHPYMNRDPRMAKTLIADGDEFKGEIIELFEGGRDDVERSAGGSVTGYFLKKYIQEDANFVRDNEVKKKHHWVIYRYAETLLTYAESMAEAFDDPGYTDGTYRYSALWAINQVRNNAGMPPVLPCGKEEFLVKLRNEWRVEFAFEDHRFWDIRRWKMGAETQKELYGVSITKDEYGVKSYKKITCESRFWNDRMYLYPISKSELYKNTNLLPQNPGW